MAGKEMNALPERWVVGKNCLVAEEALRDYLESRDEPVDDEYLDESLIGCELLMEEIDGPEALPVGYWECLC
jgi:hypothetical protein